MLSVITLYTCLEFTQYFTSNLKHVLRAILAKGTSQFYKVLNCRDVILDLNWQVYCYRMTMCILFAVFNNVYSVH